MFPLISCFWVMSICSKVAHNIDPMPVPTGILIAASACLPTASPPGSAGSKLFCGLILHIIRVHSTPKVKSSEYFSSLH